MTARLRDGVVKRGTTWSYVVRVADPESGVSRPRWVGGFATEDDAKAARDEARVLARRGEYVDKSRVTVDAYMAEWLEAHSMEIKPRTLDTYRYLVGRYVSPRIGSMRMQAVRPSTISGLYRDLLAGGGRNGRPLSRRTIDYVHAVLRKAFNDAVRSEQLLASNPVERAKRPRQEVREAVELWSADDLRTFLKQASAHRLFAFFHLAAYSGARRGELLNLRWSDLDFDGANVRIRGSAGVVAGTRIEGSTKGGRERVVSLDVGTLDVLRAHRRRQLEERMIAGGSWAGGDYVFTTGLGRPLYPDTPSQLMPKIIRAYNQPAEGEPRETALPPARLHDLRHIHATMLLLAGVPVHVVAERLGHADPSVTLRVYAHVVRQHAAGVADVFASAVQSGPTLRLVSDDLEAASDGPHKGSEEGSC